MDAKAKEAQLGLPPMELAEPNTRKRSVNGLIYYSLCLTLMIISFAGMYLAYICLTEVTLDQKRIKASDFVIYFDFTNNTRRSKRNTITPNDNINQNVLETSFSHGKIRKMRDIVMNHKKICNDGNENEICKELVLKIKSIADNKEESVAIYPKEEKIEDATKNNGNKENSYTPLDIQKRHTDPVTPVETFTKHPKVEVFHARDGDPYVYPNPGSVLLPNPLPYQTQLPSPDTCLLARLLKNNYPHLQGVYDIQQNHAPQYEFPAPLNRYPSALFPSPYGHAREEEQPHKQKVHLQDYFISLLTQKPLQTLSTQARNATTREAECPAGTISCSDGEDCIQESQWCDGKVNCADVSDESRCNCKSRVDKSRVCDGYFDCPFGEDEMGCFGCSENTFSCENLDMNSRSTCYTRDQRCNNIMDCPNQKDETDCNMLSPSLHTKSMFAVSNTEGFLHRNFKGQWHAVCRNPYMWAHDVCKRETGLIIRPPFIQIMPIDPMIKMSYIDAGPGALLQTSETCFNSSAVYVTCPDLLCGTRVLSTSQLIRENAAMENRLFGRNRRNSRYSMLFYDNRRSDEREFRNIESDNVDNLKKKRAESRVVGGKPSEPAAWPWMIALYRDGMFHCGGVILTQNWVMSAAHCVSKFWEHYYEVQVGMLRRFSYSPQEQNHRVTHVIVNQHYDQLDMKNDLSLMRVKPAIQFSRWVRPICLPGPDTAGPNWMWGPHAGTSCTAVGWGATVEHGPDPDHMRDVEVPIWSDCKHREDRAGKEICAGLVEGGKDACQGDSGGPLLCRNPLNPQQWYMAGIVSHGDGCARKDEPGVYTRVSLFVKWIRYHTSSKMMPNIRPKQECPGFKCVSGITKCLPRKRMCDKIIDCLGGEDEMNCNFMRSAEEFPIHTENVTVMNGTDGLTTKTIEDEHSEMISQETQNLITKNDSVITTESNDKIIENKNIHSTTEQSVSILKIHKFQNEPVSLNNKPNITKNKIENEKKVDTSTLKSPIINHTSSVGISTSGENSDSNNSSDESVTVDPFISEKVHSKVSTNNHRTPPAESIKSHNLTIEIKKVKKVPTAVKEADIHEDWSETFNASQTIASTLSPTTTANANSIAETTTTSIKNDVEVLLKKNNISDTLINKSDKMTHANVEPNTLVVELLPNSSDQSHESAEESVIIESTTNRIPGISSTEKQNTIEEITNQDFIQKVEELSELQPAKTRRKHVVPNEFACRRIMQNIPHSKRCDRKPDCEDGTDELDCSCVDYLSVFDENLLCDGILDCADGQDEVDCFTCPEDHFLCHSSQMCLPLKNVCDNKMNCPQGEDELDCYALSNGKDLVYNFDGRPIVALEGYLTKRHSNKWHIVCEDDLTILEQEEAANHICRYLGFSSANRYHIKRIGIKDDDLLQNLSERRNKRGTKVPIHFVYRSESGNQTSREVIINKPEIVREHCIPGIQKTCMSLYVFCDNTLFTDFGFDQSLLLGRSDEAIANKMWPWIAKVYSEGVYKCTGILVDLSWVLVSHSCLWDTTLNNHYVTAVLGSHRTLSSTNGPYEQIYEVDVMKELYSSNVALLRLRKPAHYSQMVKPMSMPNFKENATMCIAVGQDANNNTVTAFLKETEDNCDLHHRCFERYAKSNLCPLDTTSPQQWAGIISCHYEQGWSPEASFVDSRGECDIEDRIAATDIGDVKSRMRQLASKPLKSKPEYSGSTCEGVRCRRGQCVGKRQICDGIRDCEDGLDESDAACEAKHNLCSGDPFHRGCECSVSQLKCRNGKCISRELFSNGKDDCGDGSDEPGQTTCFDYLTRVTPSRLCDGVLHCQDRSDEDPAFCKCFSKKSFKCYHSGDQERCVSPDVICDGVKDCPHGEDEAACIGLHSATGTPYGKGEVIVRSHGVWYTKCYKSKTHTKTELEKICQELGFISGHAKELAPFDKQLSHPHNNFTVDNFNVVTFNNETVVKMRNTNTPLARAIFDNTIQDCYPVFIECL